MPDAVRRSPARHARELSRPCCRPACARRSSRTQFVVVGRGDSDLDRHSGEERRRAIWCAASVACAAAHRRGWSRSSSSTLGSRDGSAARAQSLGARVTPIPPSEFHHGRTRNLGAQLASRRHPRLHEAGTHMPRAGRSWLAGSPAPLRDDDRVAGAYGRQLPHAGRPTSPEQVLPRLPLRPRTDASAARSIAAARSSASRSTLFSNVNSRSPRAAMWEQRSRSRTTSSMSEDQNVVAPHPAAPGLRDRATSRGPRSTARTYSVAGAYAPVLRLRRVRGATRMSAARSPRRRCGRQALDYAQG